MILISEDCTNTCVETVDMYLNVVGSCSIMSNDYELTMGYDMIIVKVDFKLIDMIVFIFWTCGWHVWEVAGNILGISMTR